MTKAWVADAAAVTAAGKSLDETWENLLSGRTGIAAVRRFPTSSYQSSYAALIEDLCTAPGKSLIHALLDRLIPALGPIPGDCALVTATAKGGIDGLEALRRGRGNDPSDFVIGPLLEGISQRLGLRPGGLNVNAACASSTIAVARAAGWVASGRAEAVLVCCMDVITEFVFSGFSALKALSPTPCHPFDAARDGLTLGEGAAALLLMSEDRLRRDGRRGLGTVLGWGLSNDATHITAPDRNGGGLVRAARLALEMAGLDADGVAAVSAHGTGTIYNDAMELTAFRTLFGKRPVPLHSVKGALGHTLGAAGGIEVLLGLKSLTYRRIPPTVGLGNPDSAALGLVSSEAQPVRGDHLLTTNSGFGGVNAALVLGRGDAP